MAVVRRTKNLSKAPISTELSKVLAELRKQHGDKSVIVGSKVVQPWRIPTGVFSFDLATLGGLPHDRISMVHGPKHSGKTYMAMRSIMGAQQTILGNQAVLVDVEGTYEAVWSSKIGVNNDDLLVVRPDSGEQAVDITNALVRTLGVSLVVVDSLAALVPVKEQEEDADKALVGLQSKLITRMLRVISAAQIAERKRGHHVTVLLLNQQRTKIGGWAPAGIEPISLPGGKALGHFTSLEWRMKNKETISKDADGRETLSHNDHAFTLEKNKLNAGYRTGDFRLIRRDDPSTGLTEGEVDDAPIMLSYAKMAGWYGGTPKSGYTLEFGDYEPVTAANAEQMVRTIYSDREYMWALRCHLIAAEAERQGMPPWYVEYIRTGVATDVE